MTTVEVILSVGVSTILVGPVLVWGLFAVDHERRTGDGLDSTNGTALLANWFGRDVPRAGAVVLDGGSPCAGSGSSGGTEHVTLLGGIADRSATSYVEVTSTDPEGRTVRSLWRRACSATGTLIDEVELFPAVEAGTTMARCLPASEAERCPEVELRTTPRGERRPVVARASRRVDTAALAATPTNRPPRAVITADTLSGGYPLVVRFDGSSSTDAEGGVTYEWEFPGGVVRTDPQPEWTFAEPGTFAVILTVYDTGGMAHTTYVTVEVTNQPPTAVASVSPASGTVATDFVFDATDSVDPEAGAPVRYRWNFGGGVESVTDQPTITHRFGAGSALGDRVVALTVVDEYGATAETSVQVTLTGRPPTASRITMTPAKDAAGVVTLPVQFSVDGCDPDAVGCAVAAWEWAVTSGAATVWTSTAESPTVRASDIGPGSYQVSVRVRDADGEWSPTVTDSFVVQPSAPRLVWCYGKPTEIGCPSVPAADREWTMTWTAVPGATSYTVEVRKSDFCPSVPNLQTFTVAGNTTRFKYPNPCFGFLFEARVRATVNGVSGPFSAWSSK
jgi:PKD repeat protein